MIEIILWILILAFVMEFIDSTLGGGFGTVLSPLLLLAGFEPLVIVPAILLSEIFTGFVGGFLNNQMKNVDLLHDEKSKKSLMILITTGILGSVIAVFLSISIPSYYVKVYIAGLVIIMGILVLLTRNGEPSYRPKRIFGLGVLSGFNKGISGGGYGPIIVSGQIVSGLNSKAAVAITSVSEAVTCVCGLLLYLLTGNFVIVTLTISICLGAILATPFSAITITKVHHKNLGLLVGASTLTIGLYTLFRILVG